MAKDIWFSSDHHLGHSNIVKFTDSSGNPMRPFHSIEYHDEYLIEAHNSVVKPQDKVYFLGDFCLERKIGKNSEKLSRFNGHKRLVRGNHDLLSSEDYLLLGFEEIYGVRVFTPKEVGEFFVCSHVPVHPSSLYRWKNNVHGHTHSNLVMKETSPNIPDDRYISVCIEKLDNCKPRHLDEILKLCRKTKVDI